MTRAEEFRKALDAYALAIANGHFYHSAQDRIERIENISQTRAAVERLFAEAEMADLIRELLAENERLRGSSQSTGTWIVR